MLNPEKRLHSLHHLADAETFLAALVKEGIDLAEIVATCVKPGSTAGVLLGGSLAEGVGNEAADVDLLILLDSREDLRGDADGLAMQAGRAFESLVYRQGIEFNIEAFVREDVERLMESFISIAPALYDPTELKRLPLLQPYDLRFLHRLRTGWVLDGHSTVGIWQDEFMVDLLETYLTIRYLTAFHENFEDACSMLKYIPMSSIYVGRRCVEFGLLAVLAHLGYTSQSLKWLIYWCELARDTTASPILREGLDLLFCEATAAESFLRRVENLGAMIIAHLDQDPEIRRAMNFIRSRITYVTYDTQSETIAAVGGASS